MEANSYSRNMSLFLTGVPQEVVFAPKDFPKVVTEKYNKDYDLEDMITWGVLDFNRFPAKKLGAQIMGFLEKMDYHAIGKMINDLKNTRFLISQQFPLVHSISNEYYKEFRAYMSQKMASKKLKKVKFDQVTKQHLDYFKETILSNQTKRNLSVSQKQDLMQGQFPNMGFSRSTIYKI